VLAVVSRDVVVGEDLDYSPAEPVGQLPALAFLAFNARTIAAVFRYPQIKGGF
jgi:hypothetical protein